MARTKSILDIGHPCLKKLAANSDNSLIPDLVLPEKKEPFSLEYIVGIKSVNVEYEEILEHDRYLPPD